MARSMGAPTDKRWGSVTSAVCSEPETEHSEALTQPGWGQHARGLLAGAAAGDGTTAAAVTTSNVTRSLSKT